MGGWVVCVRGWTIEDLEIVPPCVVCVGSMRGRPAVHAWSVRVCVCVLCVLWAVRGLCVGGPLYMCGLCVCCVVGGGLCLGESP